MPPVSTYCTVISHVVVQLRLIVIYPLFASVILMSLMLIVGGGSSSMIVAIPVPSAITAFAGRLLRIILKVSSHS